MRAKLVAAALSLISVLFAGCGGHSSGSAGSPPASESRANTATASASTEATDLGASMNSRSFSLRSNGGYRAKLTLTSYPVARPGAVPSLPFSGRSELAACQVNPETDAVVPLAFTLTNSTQNFSPPAHVGIGHLPNAGFALFSDYSDDRGSGCGNASDQLVDASWSSVPTGSSVSGDVFVIVYNYFTPNLPNGDTDQLEQSCVVANVTLANDGLGGLADGNPDLVMPLMPGGPPCHNPF